MGSSNSKKDQSDDLYFAETAVSRISTQYQTERKVVEIEDIFVQNLSQESTSTDNFSTFIPSTQDSIEDSIQRMLQIRRSVNDESDIDGMDSDDSYDSESDEPKQNIRVKQPALRFPKQNLNSSQRPNPQGVKRFDLLSAISKGLSLHPNHPGGTNPTLGVRNFEMSSELTEMNYEATTVNTSAIQA